MSNWNSHGHLKNCQLKANPLEHHGCKLYSKDLTVFLVLTIFDYSFRVLIQLLRVDCGYFSEIDLTTQP